MTQYLISIYQPDGETPPPEFLEAVGRKLHVLNQELKAAGAWVFTGGLHAPSTATVVRAARARTSSPRTARTSRARSTSAGSGSSRRRTSTRRSAGRARRPQVLTPLPIEVRPFQDHSGY